MTTCVPTSSFPVNHLAPRHILSELSPRSAWIGMASDGMDHSQVKSAVSAKNLEAQCDHGSGRAAVEFDAAVEA